jgi:NitT/TauT family transport system substrate-binding protein
VPRRSQNARPSVGWTFKLLTLIVVGTFAVSYGSQAKEEAKLRTLKVAYTVTQPNLSELGLFYARDHGLFEKYGLDVNIQMLNGDTLGLQSLASGDSDIAWISNQLLYQGIANGTPIKGFIEASPVQDYELITKSEVSDIKAMAGRTLATSGPGGIAEVLPFAVFKEHGLDPSLVRTVNAGGTSGRLQALAGGRVDAAMGHVIDRIRFAAKVAPGQFHVLSNFGKDLSHFQFAVFAAQTKVLGSRLEDFTAFTKGLLEGTRIVAKDEAVAIAEFRQYNKDMSDEQLHEAYATLQSIGMFAVNGGIEKQNFDFTVKTLREANVLSKSLEYADAFDTRAKDAALKAIGTLSGGN